MNPLEHKCSICGAPATNAARDLVETIDFRTGERRFAPCNPDVITYGCSEHVAVSCQHRLPTFIGLSLAKLYSTPAETEETHG